MTWNAWIRPLHRWTSIVFVAVVAAIFIALGLGKQPVDWVYYLPLAPLALLALTGLSPETLREAIEDPALLAAALRFLEAHEPDLVACAEAIGTTPLHLVETRRRLER